MRDSPGIPIAFSDRFHIGLPLQSRMKSKYKGGGFYPDINENFGFSFRRKRSCILQRYIQMFIKHQGSPSRPPHYHCDYLDHRAHHHHLQRKCLQNVRSSVFRWASTQITLARAASETIEGFTGEYIMNGVHNDDDGFPLSCLLILKG